MRKSQSKALALSAVAHAVLLLALLQLGHSQTMKYHAPRTISATLLQKGAVGLPKQSGGASDEPNKISEPEKKNLTPPSKIPPKENLSKQAAPTLPAKKSKTEKPAATPAKTALATPSKNPFAKGEGGTSPKPLPNQTSGGGAGGNAALGSKSGTGGGGGVRLDATDFPFPHYLTLLQFRIESQWRPPYAGQDELLATVHFVVDKSGKVLSTELEKSSGVFAFDQAALRAVQSANPLPALPAGSNLETLGVHFDFVARR
jgi:protein TonB